MFECIKYVFLLCNRKDLFLSVCSADNKIFLSLNWKNNCRACSEMGFGMNFHLFFRNLHLMFCAALILSIDHFVHHPFQSINTIKDMLRKLYLHVV